MMSGTAAPWFTALLMPDIMAPALVLALALLGFAAERLSRAEVLGLQAVATLAIAVHLSHLPVAAALVVLVLLVARRWRPALRCAVPLGLAIGLLLGTNWAMHGRLAVSPYGSVFALARLVADGPAARTIEARCPPVASPGAGWHLCRWAGRLPTDSDDFLWTEDGPVWAPRTDGAQPGGPISLAPEASAIITETLWREPLAVLRDAFRNGVAQMQRTRVGDALGPENMTDSVVRQLALGFPAAEQARFAAGLQASGLLREVAAPFLVLHPLVLLLGGAAALFGWWRAAVAGDARMLGLMLMVLVGVTVNAVATGALSGPHDRYQARIAWLLPLAGLLAVRRPALARNEACKAAAV
jgi:hypothetical protein